MNTLRKIQGQFGEKLSREELRNVAGGDGLCMTDGDCPAGFMCIGGVCGGTEEYQAAVDACVGKSTGESCTIPQKPGRTGECGHMLTGPLLCKFGMW